MDPSGPSTENAVLFPHFTRPAHLTSSPLPSLPAPQEPEHEWAQPRVSPYRLAAHLVSAFAIYATLVWTTLGGLRGGVETLPVRCSTQGHVVTRVRQCAGVDHAGWVTCV